MQIIDHKLKDVRFESTPNMGGVITPEYLVVHYTVTQALEGVVRAFKSPAHRASAHLVLGQDGELVQMVPFNCTAWHAGKSEWAGRPGCNSFTIGVEIVNPGPLVKRGDEFFDVNNQRWNGDVVEARHKNGVAKYDFWAAYSNPQLERLEEVGRALSDKYDLRGVVGHDDIAPRRKIDPGPAFPLERLRSVLFGRADDGAEEFETTSELNVRKGPAVSFDPVPGSPLPKGKRVQYVTEDGLWWHIIVPGTTVEGWVHSRFLMSV